jgi:glycosyltransferase involved in cell wall biosynthesis
MGASLPWYHGIYMRLMPWVNRRFDGIVVNGEMVKRHVESAEGAPGAKVRVIYNGIDLPPADEPAPALYRDELGAFWVGATANLKTVKRLDLLLDAMVLIREEHRVANVRTVVLGEGPERAALESRAAQLGLTGKVHFPGAVRDVTAHVRCWDAAVLCSDKEGLSNAMMEYMACGRPVVATSVGEAPALVDDSNGALIPPGDAPALAAALAQLAKDPALRLRQGARSRRKIEERFSWPKAMSSLEGYYRELAGERS